MGQIILYLFIFLLIFSIFLAYFLNIAILFDVLNKKGYEDRKHYLKTFIPIYGNKEVKKLTILNSEISQNEIDYLYRPYYIVRKALTVGVILALTIIILIPISILFYLTFVNRKVFSIMAVFLVILIYLVYHGMIVDYAKKKGYEGLRHELVALVPVYGFIHFKNKKSLRATSKESFREIYSFKNILSRLLIYAELTFMVTIVVLPVIYIFGMALSNMQGNIPATLWPENPSFKAFAFLFEETNFWKWYKNTLSIAVINMLVGTVIITGASYVFARFSFKGKKAGLLTILVLQAFPSFMGLIAMYVLFWKFGLLGKPLALSILYIGGSIPGNLWLIKGFLDQIPKDLDESAMIDGASKLKIFTTIILPLAIPILTFVAVSMFMGPWMDYMLPSYLLDHMFDSGNQTDRWTLAVGIFKFINDNQHLNYSAFAAASLIVGLPIAILYMVFQKYLIEGIMAGATKG